MASALIQDVTMENLYPALVECFAVILCGYVAGRTGIVTQEQSSGLSTFVGTFCLPSLIFVSLAVLDLSSVNWFFLVSILIAKAIVFFTVVLITILITKPLNPARAGLYAIFCTQSNDFAIGFPIVAALYNKTHPDYVSYLYLLAPVSLVILNPFGFVLMEIGKHESLPPAESGRRKLTMATNIMYSIITNPVVLMTVLGMIANFICNHKLPSILADTLNVFGSAFTGTALFLLGLRMVGKVQNLQGWALLVPGILIAVKLLALPLVTREVVSIVLHASHHSPEEVLDLSTFGFLYGTFPSAPGVFVYATLYALDIDLIASAMVACTFLSAPLMFVSARMVTVSNLNPVEFLATLHKFEYDVSFVTAFASVWLLVMFIIDRKYQLLPNRMVMFLVLSNLVGNIGLLLGNIIHPYAHYVHFLLQSVGDLSTHLWTCIIAVSLLLIECNSMCLLYRLQPLFAVIAWLFPLVAITVLMLTVTPQLSETSLNYEYGEAQAGIILFVLIVSFTITIGCLVLHQWYLQRRKHYLVLVKESSESGTGNVQHEADNENNIPYISDEGSNGVNGSVKEHCCQHSPAAEEGISTPVYNDQIMRLIVLLVFLTCTVFINLSVCVWRIVMEQFSGVYVEMVFIESSLNRAQGLLVLCIYGLDMSTIFEPVVTRMKSLWYGGNTVQLPAWDELEFETQHVCEQFITHHLDQCRHDIVKTYRWRFSNYKHVFTGTALVNWLLENNLSQDRSDALQYGTHLLYGRVITHIHNTQLFCDKPDVLYSFVSPED